MPCGVKRLRKNWIDDANGYVVRRRVGFRRKGPMDPGVLSFVYACKDVKITPEGVGISLALLRASVLD